MLELLMKESINAASTEDERIILQQRLDKQESTVVTGHFVRYMKADSTPGEHYRFAILREVQFKVEYNAILDLIRTFQFAEGYFVFKFEDQRFMWSKYEDKDVADFFEDKKVSLVKGLSVCSRCGGCGLYKAPTGHLTSVNGVKHPICFGCKGKGYTK